MAENTAPPRPTQGTVQQRFAMATHHGLRCDARGRSCIKLADVEFTLRPVDPDTGETGDAVTKLSCPRHRSEFLDDPDTWEYVSARKFIRLPNGRLRNMGFVVGSQCDDTCTSCAHKRRQTEAGDTDTSAGSAA